MRSNHTALFFSVFIFSIGCGSNDPSDPTNACMGLSSDPNIASNCITYPPETDTDTGTDTGTSTITATDTLPTTATQTSVTTTSSVPSWCNESVTSEQAGERINFPGTLTATCGGTVWKLAIRAPSGTTATTAQATAPGSTKTITFAGQMGKNCTYLSTTDGDPTAPTIRGTGFQVTATDSRGGPTSASISGDSCSLLWSNP